MLDAEKTYSQNEHGMYRGIRHFEIPPAMLKNTMQENSPTGLLYILLARVLLLSLFVVLQKGLIQAANSRLLVHLFVPVVQDFYEHIYPMFVVMKALSPPFLRVFFMGYSMVQSAYQSIDMPSHMG